MAAGSLQLRPLLLLHLLLLLPLIVAGTDPSVTDHLGQRWKAQLRLRNRKDKPRQMLAMAHRIAHDADRKDKTIHPSPHTMQREGRALAYELPCVDPSAAFNLAFRNSSRPPWCLRAIIGKISRFFKKETTAGWYCAR